MTTVSQKQTMNEVDEATMNSHHLINKVVIFINHKKLRSQAQWLPMQELLIS